MSISTGECEFISKEAWRGVRQELTRRAAVARERGKAARKVRRSILHVPSKLRCDSFSTACGGVVPIFERICPVSRMYLNLTVTTRATDVPSANRVCDRINVIVKLRVKKCND